jgi:hypothetical protein
MAGLLASAITAQQPYTVAIYGTVSSCYPGQTVNVQTAPGVSPIYNVHVAVQPGSCTWTAFLNIASNPAAFMATTMCNGMTITLIDSVQFNSFPDSAYVQMAFSCGGGQYDCNGVINGPDMPGTACDDGNAQTVNDLWQANCTCSGTLNLDCMGVLNGPAMPGTACDDGDSLTTNDAWTAYCTCAGDSSYYNNLDCLGIYQGPNMPGTTCDDGDPATLNDVWNSSCYCAGVDPNVYDCLGIVNGPNMPGTPCVYTNDTTTSAGIWNLNCTCWPDSGNTYDCLGIPFGTALPGTACNDGDPATMNDTWNSACVCTGNNGSNLLTVTGTIAGCTGSIPVQILDLTYSPGLDTVIYTDNNCSYTFTYSPTNSMLGWVQVLPSCDGGSTWMYDSIGYSFSGLDTVVMDFTCGDPFDCMGISGGPAMPGTPCIVPGTTLSGTWSANCACEATADPCNAEFWVLQAFGSDSLAIPYELWVWNLSTGGSGNYTNLWSFGDGTSSSDPFPTHTYSGNGPYLLCLTIDDGEGCQNTYCDSVSIDGNGMYTGMLGGGTDRQDGFTINVQPSQANGVNEHPVINEFAAWPNPVANDLNIAMVSDVHGLVDVVIMDLNGRVVRTERRTLTIGRNQLQLNTEDLGAGLYMLRIGSDANTLGLRFMKVD